MSRMQENQPQQTSLFPKIFRFITEKGILIVVCIVSLVVLSGIVLQVLKLQDTLHQVELTKEKRVELTKELAYWQDVVRRYGDYRDAYYKIATLQYQLGEIHQAKKSLEQVLALDPNFEEAKILGAKIASE